MDAVGRKNKMQACTRKEPAVKRTGNAAEETWTKTISDLGLQIFLEIWQGSKQ